MEPAKAGPEPEDGALDPRSCDGTLTLSISGIRFELRGLPSGLRPQVAQRFSLFIVDSASADNADLKVRIRPAEVGAYLDYDKQGEAKIYRLETHVEDGRLYAWSYAFAGWFEIEGEQAELVLCDSEIEPPSKSIENFLRVAFAWKASKAGGFLFHASGLVRGGRAYIFFGPSGSGK